MTFDPYFTPYKELPKCRSKHKSLKLGHNLFDLGLSKDFLDTVPKASVIRGKNKLC